MKAFKELNFIKEIKEKVPAGGGNLVKGIGDDTAIIGCSEGKELLVTCDLMTEGVHFSLDYFLPEDIGWRALAANLSDIASMGGKPLYFTLSIAVPPHLKKGSFLVDFLRGLLECADKYGVVLIGGDTSSSKDSMFIDISMIGEAEKGRALKRSGAAPGDLIYVLGNPGRAEAGLQLFLAGWKIRGSNILNPDCGKYIGENAKMIFNMMLAHLRPEPCLKEGKILSDQGIPSAMIDTSDGISTDLFHICEESGVGAELDYSAFDESELNMVKEILPEMNAEHCILNGGEDYSLLFTVPETKRVAIDSLNSGPLASRPRLIGRITDDAGRMTVSFPGREKMILKPSGWEHK